ncbi:MAG: MltA domain-containing protein [Drouetiella hepatica Uher 2000/2452]|jgi:membrane-bound lytic murein transglycosylase A|uniref:peptidoglycan lytic exotransglycosylase n=1 Tax=Drouetiella hepatica Uher 2000/2452 TaxID=904376 RepID=A0A951QA98_9CYAN|nr:MltA domain-containing protein [Drouetiella hepatica Uher 2000/2452]
MRSLLFCLTLFAVLTVSASPIRSEQGLPLQPVASPGLAQGLDNRLWGTGGNSGDRSALIQSIDRSLTYLASPAARTAYRQYAIPAFTADRVYRSLERFRELLLGARSPEELQASVIQEFVFYQSVGKDGQGTVGFTGYFEPTYAASRVPTAEYRYPLYRLPPNMRDWSRPQPTRLQLEGADGLQASQGKLRGLELVWLRDRLEAYLVQVQGSARLQLKEGGTMSVGVAGHTDYPYVSIGRALVDAGKFKLEELTLPRLIQYFRDNPADLDLYLPRNNRFIFFEETGGAPATGSLGLAVTAERSIATDKSLMPPGALAFIQTQLPTNSQGQLVLEPASRYVLDQDTGGAIRGAGRVDVFMGTGSQAGDRAGLINSNGQLYYLLLRE